MLGDSIAAQDGGRQDSILLDRPAFDVAEYWRLAMKHRLLILGCFLAALVIGVAATLLMTPIYKASTTIQIDREAARVLNVDDVSPQESLVQGEEFFQTQHGILRSRSLAERVIDDIGLATSDAFLEEMNVSLRGNASGNAAERLAQRREAVIDAVQKNLTVSPVRGSRLVIVSFESPDPVLSARIANAFAENFISSNLDRKFESSRYAREFLEELIAQTKARLEDSERQLVNYAARQQIINLNEGAETSQDPRSLTGSNLVALNAAMAEARAERIAAEERWRQASTAAPNSLPQVIQNPAYQRLTEELAKLTAEYERGLRIYQPDFPEMRQLRSQIDELQAQQAQVANGIRNSIRNEYAVARNAEQALQRQVDSLKGEVLNLRERSIDYNIIQREVDTSRTLYDGLLQRYKEVGVTGGVTTNNISVIDEAVPPEKPSKPKLLFNLVIAAVLGLGLGVLAAFVIEALDETLSTPDDVEAKLGLPVLGTVPLLDKEETPASALADIRSPFSESYYSLRTALQFTTPHGAPTTLLVTSSRPAEGKSTTAYAIALNLARVGKRVLLVDGDLRNPSMHRVVGVNNDRGMSNFLSGDGDLPSLALETPNRNLSFLPCGPLPPNPAELWGSDQLGRALREATELYDHLVIDGPPVLGLADAPLLASAVEGTVFVLESRATRRAQARGAIRRLLVGRGRLLGVVLTKFNAKSAQYGGYEYAYDYDYGPGGSSKTQKRR